ncbi:gluconokinase [Aspergillus mulundensis]|uniref:Gluconokinase n=1 Tax=Aspergillus mulundensis TaxID=1810919 RepID=A0A3D8T6K1_9EURO|nr:Gluconokinase [Aspergillus mulundensis]RDW94150.1 Gluconokinase [Aspergillus mulundensis]
MLSASERNPTPVMDPSRTKVSALNHNHTHHHTVPSASAQQQLANSSMPPQFIQHIWVVTGPAGSGKSTVGRYLEQELGVPFLEGDDFHPPANKAKMSTGTPLTDADRWDWLISLRSAATTLLSTPVPIPTPTNPTATAAPRGVVVACSALKKKYRDVMRVAAYGSPNVHIHFVYLKLEAETLYARVSARQAHYMKQSMVESQLRDLEEPRGDEWDALTVPVKVEMGMGDVQREVMLAVRGVVEEYEKAS